MAVRTPEQLATRRRVEAGIRLVAPLLDVLLGAADRVSRAAGRDEVGPEPPRRPLDSRSRSLLGAGRDRA